MRKIIDFIKKIFTDLIAKIKYKSEQKKREKEQKRKEEIKRLEEKQQANKFLISTVKNKLNDLQKTFKELQDSENAVSAIYDEIIDKMLQIDVLHEKPSKFILKLLDDVKIKNLTNLCEKQKKSIEEYEKTFDSKKEEMTYLINVLSDSFKDYYE